MKTFLKRTLAAMFCASLMAGAALVPPPAAYAAEYVPTMTVASSKVSQLAPGVTETAVVAYDASDARIVYYVINADMATNRNVLVKANYHDNDNTGVWGKATVIEQANSAAEKRGYNVVASTNASYYNVSTGQPSGAFVMEGVNVNGDAAGNSGIFFAVLKDGTAMIGEKGTWNQYAANVQEAIGGHIMLIKDGVICDDLNETDKYPRSTVGIKSDGNVVLMVADGNQRPYSAGLTLQEQAEVMYSLGCVDAVELDGGGSATYAAKLEGTDEVVIRNSCCDGTVRSVSNTLMVVSSAAASGDFDHANLSTDDAFYAAGSSVTIHAVGADEGGFPAAIPADVAWALSDDSFGSVSDGVFVSNGKVGTVAVRMLNGEREVGSVDVTVVHPTSIAFSSSEKTVPYGRTSDFTIAAMYNGANVHIEAGAFTFTCTAGSMDGFVFTAPDEASGSTEATVTATYHFAELDAVSVHVTFGKGSDVLFDFENAEEPLQWGDNYDLLAAKERGECSYRWNSIYHKDGVYDFPNYVVEGIQEDVRLADAQTGKVHSGSHSLAYTFDYTQSAEHGEWQYGYLCYWGDNVVLRDTQDIHGTRFGMWIYIPPEAVGSCARIGYKALDTDGKYKAKFQYLTYQYVKRGFSKIKSETIPEAGWSYVSVDFVDLLNGGIDVSLNPPYFIQFIVSSSAVGAEKVTFYIDDITLDYSDVVDDRDMPIISRPLVLDDQNSYDINGNTVGFSTVSVTANVAEDVSHAAVNASGLDGDTAQIYVDSHEVPTSYSAAAGTIAASGIVLPNGTHDITFEIADRQGNLTRMTRQLVVADPASSYPTVEIVGQALSEGPVKTGGQYNLLINTDKAEAIDDITTTVWLNSASRWALEHASVLPGFAMSYTVDDNSGIASISIRRVDSQVSGSATLLTIPVYAWCWDGSAGWDAQEQWAKNHAPQVTISYKVMSSQVRYTHDFQVTDPRYIAGFSNVRADVETELNSSIANLKGEGSIGEWHSHEAAPLPDKAASCTEDGYTGRTYCEACGSIIDWGTTIPAAHPYAFTEEGILQCAVCGKTMTGVWLDGNEYQDGVLVNGYLAVDGVYHVFANGETTDATYTGLVYVDGNWSYSKFGTLVTGWIVEGDDYYYFDPTSRLAVNGAQTIDGCDYQFEDYRLIEGAFVTDSTGGTVYMWAGAPKSAGWLTVGEHTYYINRAKHLVTGTYYIETSDYSGDGLWYLFDEDGVLQGKADGLIEDAYYRNGVLTSYLGLVQIEDDYYYVFDYGKVVKNQDVYISTAYANGLIPNGTYHFGEDGKMAIYHGPVGQFVYDENGHMLHAYQLVPYDGDYYFISDYHRYVKDKTIYLTAEYLTGTGLLPGNYVFDADGKMAIKNGPNEDGYFYLNDVKQQAYQLIEYKGAYYFIYDCHKYAVNRTLYVAADYLEGTRFVPGTFTFDADGRMVIKNGPDEDGHLYLNGVKQTAYQLVHFEDHYYFISDYHRYVKDKTVYLTAEYLTGTGLLPGNYVFDADGKMQLRNGPNEDGYFYLQGVRKPAYQLVEYEGAYYFIYDCHKYAVNRTLYVAADYLEGTRFVPGTFTFDADGRMVIKNGPDEDGHLYLNGVKQTAYQLARFEDHYYFISDYHRYVKDKTVYLTAEYLAGTGLLPGNYVFDADGKMMVP